MANWLAAGGPSLTGVKWLGSAFHMGRESAEGAVTPAFNSTQDVDFDHEAELTHSGRYAIATDERGGGILPPGASCSPSTDLTMGNGGLHAYRVDKLLKRRPTSSADAFTSYAKNSKGGKAIFRAQVRTKPQAALCTAHVFQQIPGQNRIFMGWYAQGTQVVDFEENANGTLDFKEAGYFIPANADQWVSHIFKVQRNSNGSFTYFGAAADFALGDGGRNTVEVYKVTLPAPPAPRGSQFGLGEGFRPSTCLARKGEVRPQEHRPPAPGPVTRAHGAPGQAAGQHQQAHAGLPLLREGRQQGPRPCGVRQEGQEAAPGRHHRQAAQDRWPGPGQQDQQRAAQVQRPVRVDREGPAARPHQVRRGGVRLPQGQGHLRGAGRPRGGEEPP